MSGFHGAFATGVPRQQGTLTLPDTWFRPPFWDLLHVVMLQLLRPNSLNLPCLYSTFHLEYPLVLSRFWSFWNKAFSSYQLHNVTATDMKNDLDLWPTDLNIYKDHLLIKDYLPTNFEASEAKRFWVISCTTNGQSTWTLTLTFDLLTWKSIGIIYLSLTIYLPSLKIVGQSIVELWVAQGIGDQHDLWTRPLTYWPEYCLFHCQRRPSATS